MYAWVLFCITAKCFCFFPLIVDVFQPIFVCDPDLSSVNRFRTIVTIEQRYTSVAFMYNIFKIPVYTLNSYF